MSEIEHLIKPNLFFHRPVIDLFIGSTSNV